MLFQSYVFIVIGYKHTAAVRFDKIFGINRKWHWSVTIGLKK